MMFPADKPTVGLAVREVTPRTLSVTWTDDDNSEFETRVDSELVLDASILAREALRMFVETWCTRGSTDELPNRFQSLCQNGHGLYQALFTTMVDSPYNGKEVRDWLESKLSSVRIVVKVDASISVPWNILCVQPHVVEESIRMGEWCTACASFWALQFAVSVSTYGFAPRAGQSGVISTYDVVAVANRQIQETASSQLRDASILDLEDDRQVEKWVRELCEQIAYSFADFFQRWRQKRGLDFRLAYFLGHRNLNSPPFRGPLRERILLLLHRERHARSGRNSDVKSGALAIEFGLQRIRCR